MNSDTKTNGTITYFLTVSEAASALKVSQKTVYRLLERGLLKAQPQLRHKRITMASVEKFATAIA